MSEGLKESDASANLIALISAGVLALVTWTTVIFAKPTTMGWFAFHPLFNSAALGSLTYAVLTLQPTSQPKAKVAGLGRHQLAALGFGFPFVLLGTSAVYYNKSLRGAEHFTTWHGTLGGISISWMIGQILIGGLSVWRGGAAFGGGPMAKRAWKYHRISGYVLFTLLILTTHLAGMWSNWVRVHTSWLVRVLAYSAAPALILLGVIARVRVSKLKFF